MALEGTGFLALWNDFDSARDDEYECWHTFEHVPERVGIDGVLSGRRYVARERSHWRYFTLYELTALDALDGASYLDVVRHPTEWSASMRASFRNFVRRPCTTEFSGGQGHGAALSTHRITLSRPCEPSDWRALLHPLVDDATAVAIHVGRVDVSAKFPLGDAMAGEALGVPHVLLIEAVDRDRLARAVAPVLASIRERIGGIEAIDGELYDLALTVLKADLADPDAKRQRPRPDLGARW